jgi:hypothetical protein
MESIVSEFAKLFFQPPVLILFALAVAGLSTILNDRSEYRFRADMEWRARESFYRRDAGFNEELISRARRLFYERKHLKEPRVKGKR